MKSRQNKKMFANFASMTWQELAVKQLLLGEKIPFVQQKQIQLSQCHVIVDFLINHSIVLEVSATRMHRHGVPLKLKALQIEAKFAQLRQETDCLLWVLFESTRRIPPRLYRALRRRMPSTDRLLTSRPQLQRILQAYFPNVVYHPPSKRVLRNKNESLPSFFGEKQFFMNRPKHKRLNNLVHQPMHNKSLFHLRFVIGRGSYDPVAYSRLVHKYSHHMKKEFSAENPETEVKE